MKNTVRIGLVLTILVILICFSTFLINLDALMNTSSIYENNLSKGQNVYLASGSEGYSYDIRVSFQGLQFSNSAFIEGKIYLSINSVIIGVYSFLNYGATGNSNGFPAKVNHLFSTTMLNTASDFNITVLITNLSGGVGPITIWVFQDVLPFLNMDNLLVFFLIMTVICLIIESIIGVLYHYNPDEFDSITTKIKILFIASPIIGIILMAIIPLYLVGGI